MTNNCRGTACQLNEAAEAYMVPMQLLERQAVCLDHSPMKEGEEQGWS